MWRGSSRSQNGSCLVALISGCKRSSPASAVQQWFFPEGLAFDGERLVGTAAAAPAFSYLREISAGDERVMNHQRDRDWLAETAGLSGLPASRSGRQTERSEGWWT
jgi:hypothetical protein